MVSTQIDWAPDTAGALPAQGPVAPSSRIEGIDVLRGLALFGVLAINIVFEFRVSIFEQFLPPAGTIPAIDRALSDVLAAVVNLNTPVTVEPFATGFRNALAALGLVDGRNIRLEVRLADGHVERLPELAQSLVRAKASVILAFGPPAIRAAQQATSTIPIVANADILASGLIGSLAKPGGNTTGVSMLVAELDAKRLEILKEIVPSGRRFALLSVPET